MCVRLQYVNPACAKALNYSAPGEVVGRHVDEALTSDKNPIDIYSKIKQQLESGQVRILHRTPVTKSFPSKNCVVNCAPTKSTTCLYRSTVTKNRATTEKFINENCKKRQVL